MASRSVRCLFDNQTPYDLTKVSEPPLDSGIYTGGWEPPATIEAQRGGEWHCESDGIFTGAVGSVTYQFTKRIPSKDPTKDDQLEIKNVFVQWANPFVGLNSTKLSVTDDFTGTKSTDVEVANDIQHGDLENVIGTIAFPIMAFANSTSHPDATAVFGIRMKATSGLTTDSNQGDIRPYGGNFIQSSYGVVGNYEMLVPQGSKLAHYWRDNDDPNYRWHRGQVFDLGPQIGANQAKLGESALGVALLQSSIKYDGVHGNFEVVAWLHRDLDAGSTGDSLFFCGYDTAKRQWTSLQPVLVDGQTIAGVTGF